MNSNSDRLPIILFIVGIALVGGMVFKRYSQKQNKLLATPNAVPEATPQPIPAQATPTPSPTPQPATPPPTMPTPMAAPNMPPEAMITDPEKVKALMEKLAKGGLGKEMDMAKFQAEAQRKGQIMAQALNSESSAREALKELESCVNQPDPFTGAGLKMPAAAAQQMAASQASSRANCVSTAKQIATKFPALRDEAESKVIHPKK